MVASTAQPTMSPPEADRVQLPGITWETYEHLLNDLEQAGRPLKLVYDRGTLEIEMPTKIHEIIKTFVGQLLEHYLIATGGHFLSLGEATWKRHARLQGLESDACYYIQRVAAVGDGEAIDLERDPPPDLAIEIEVSVPLIDKLPIYLSLGIEELWHIRAPDSVEFLRRDSAGSFRAIDRSVAAPAFTPALIQKFIRLRKTVGNAEAVRTAIVELQAAG
jgi:Uma2 family endonuclease